MSGITVLGHGRVTGRPDVMSITAVVSVAKPTVGEAVSGAADAASRLLSAVAGEAIPERDVALPRGTRWQRSTIPTSIGVSWVTGSSTP